MARSPGASGSWCATPTPPSAIARRSAAGSPARPRPAACGSGRPCSRVAAAASPRGATRAAAAGRPGAAASRPRRHPLRPRPRRTRRRPRPRTRRSGPRPWSAAVVRHGQRSRRYIGEGEAWHHGSAFGEPIRSRSSRPGTSSDSPSRRATARSGPACTRPATAARRRSGPTRRRGGPARRGGSAATVAAAGASRDRSRSPRSRTSERSLRTFTVNFEAHCEALPEALRGGFAFQPHEHAAARLRTGACVVALALAASAPAAAQEPLTVYSSLPHVGAVKAESDDVVRARAWRWRITARRPAGIPSSYLAQRRFSGARPLGSAPDGANARAAAADPRRSPTSGRTTRPLRRSRRRSPTRPGCCRSRPRIRPRDSRDRCRTSPSRASPRSTFRWAGAPTVASRSPMCERPMLSPSIWWCSASSGPSSSTTPSCTAAAWRSAAAAASPVGVRVVRSFRLDPTGRGASRGLAAAVRADAMVFTGITTTVRCRCGAGRGRYAPGAARRQRDRSAALRATRSEACRPADRSDRSDAGRFGLPAGGPGVFDGSGRATEPSRTLRHQRLRGDVRDLDSIDRAATPTTRARSSTPSSRRATGFGHRPYSIDPFGDTTLGTYGGNRLDGRRMVGIASSTPR